MGMSALALDASDEPASAADLDDSDVLVGSGGAYTLNIPKFSIHVTIII